MFSLSLPNFENEPSMDEIREDFRRNGIDSDLTDSSTAAPPPPEAPKQNVAADLNWNNFASNTNSFAESNNLNTANTTNGTNIFSPEMTSSNLFPVQLELYVRNLLQAGYKNNLINSLLYQQQLELQNNNFLGLLSDTNSCAVKMSDNANTSFVEFRARECGFCKSNKETKEFYTSHYLKNSDGHVVCPILSKYVCPYCQATGIYAHTKGYCPKKPATETGYNQFRNVDKFFKFRNTCAEKTSPRDTIFKHRVF
ncbi:protein nanos [Planococcus citri]|uniref:protein nanos n=1 Tax=Planococcus citri TaxID=170843 RepID=UPI0031F735B3